MKLIFRQRVFSWFDSYDIYNENGSREYCVKGQLAWGHCFRIYDNTGDEVGMIKERIIKLLPKFDIYIGESCVGCISKDFSLLTPKYSIDFNGWKVRGSFTEWDYEIDDTNGRIVASVHKSLLRMTDTYEINVLEPDDALEALMFVIAIDAEKCSRG